MDADIDEIMEPGTEDQYDLLQDSINQQLYRILQHLSPQEREFLNLRYGMQLSNDEIGAIYSINGKAVSERYRRLLKKCREIAKEYNIREELDL
jgi:RNA polymerase sigma factor (sigma-70 family)